MRSQPAVSSAKILERIRVLGNSLKVVNGPKHEANLAEQLKLSGYTPAELSTAIEQLVSEGALLTRDEIIDLGSGGITNGRVTEEVVVYSINARR